jgi:hypothetical protein
MKNLSLLLLAIVIGVGYTAYAGKQTAPEMARCVNPQNHVVADDLCRLPGRMVHVNGSLNPVQQYRRYYGGFGGSAVGSTAWGGSDHPLTGHLYRAANGRPTTTTVAAQHVRPDFYLGTGHSGR